MPPTKFTRAFQRLWQAGLLTTPTRGGERASIARTSTHSLRRRMSAGTLRGAAPAQEKTNSKVFLYFQIWPWQIVILSCLKSECPVFVSVYICCAPCITVPIHKIEISHEQTSEMWERRRRSSTRAFCSRRAPL